jgi:hypothetical protein
VTRRLDYKGENRIVGKCGDHHPMMLFVKTIDQTTATDHFGGNKPNYQGSQSRKFLFQICQDDEAVKRILWSRDPLIACIEIEEGKIESPAKST